MLKSIRVDYASWLNGSIFQNFCDSKKKTTYCTVDGKDRSISLVEIFVLTVKTNSKTRSAQTPKIHFIDTDTKVAISLSDTSTQTKSFNEVEESRRNTMM